jgi:hypothetical protein
MADQRACKTAGNSTHCSAAPAVADSTTDNSACTGTDRGSLFSRCAGSKRANEGANKHNPFHHDISPSFFRRLDATKQHKNNNNQEN